MDVLSQTEGQFVFPSLADPRRKTGVILLIIFIELAVTYAYSRAD